MLPLVINLRAVPLIIFAIPLYLMYQWLGLLDTRLGLGLILAIVNIPLALVILVNAISDVPVELDEAAAGRRRQFLARADPHPAPVVRPALGDRLHLRLHHRLERVPVRADADHEPRLCR